MASPSGTTTSSGSQEDLQQLMDQRKRMISNRETARRSRMRKQKHLDDLMAQVALLKQENKQISTKMSVTTQLYLNVEAENSILRAQMAELRNRLQYFGTDQETNYRTDGGGRSSLAVMDQSPQTDWRSQTDRSPQSNWSSQADWSSQSDWSSQTDWNYQTDEEAAFILPNWPSVDAAFQGSAEFSWDFGEENNNNSNDVEYTTSQFMEFMETKLSWKNPTTKWNGDLWVFWSYMQPLLPQTRTASSSSSSHLAVNNTETIKSELCCFRWDPGDTWKGNLLIQFWAATVTDECPCVLTTRNQPFALGKLDTGFSSYRKKSLTYTIKVDHHNDDEEQHQQLPGRVFGSKFPEASPNVSLYSTTEYPQRDFALSCGVRSSLALPVFELSGSNLLGVLELVSTDDNILRQYIEGRLPQALDKIINLKSPFRHNLSDKNILQQVAKEINKVLEVVCQTHQLPLAQSWVIGTYHICNSVRSTCFGDVMVVTNNATSINFEFELSWSKFKEACKQLGLVKNKGLVGKALLSHKPCFCRDITQFNMTDYPLAHYARDCGSIGCFSICLRSYITGNRDYVLEFFLPSWKMDNYGPQTFLKDLLKTLKEHSKTFMVASGEKLGEELFVEVIKSSINDESDTLRICQDERSLTQSDALESEGEAMALVPSDQQLMVEDAAEKALKHKGEVVPLDTSDQQLMVEDAMQHYGNVLVPEQGETIPSIEKSFIKETSKREYEKINDISYEVLEQHFGRPLEEVAESFNVSRSTFKRECRKCGITRWPSCKRKTVDSSPFKLRRVGEEYNRIELSCLDMPPMQATSSVAHTSQDVYPMTVKATYKGVIIRFRLSSSSGMAKLEEKVTERLPLEKRNFSIKYQDDEGDLILIACDEDLQTCMDISRSLKKTTIKMSIDTPITH